VLFTDLVGFTQIGARLTLAELAALLNAHFTDLAEAIEAEEGTLDKYIGAPGRVNYTLIGDTVNIAQRLEGLGKEVSPDAEIAIQISADTKATLEGDFAVQSVGQYQLRGQPAPLGVYQLACRSD
jgi:class 3 adenylate cyclase